MVPVSPHHSEAAVKTREPDQVEAARAEAVAEPAGDQHRDGVGQQVGAGHPHHRVHVGAEVLDDRGRRDGDDRGVDQDHEEAQAQGPQGRPRVDLVRGNGARRGGLTRPVNTPSLGHAAPSAGLTFDSGRETLGRPPGEDPHAYLPFSDRRRSRAVGVGAAGALALSLVAASASAAVRLGRRPGRPGDRHASVRRPRPVPPWRWTIPAWPTTRRPPPTRALCPTGVGSTPIAGFPTNGSTFAIITSGNAALADDPNDSGGSGEDWGVSGDADRTGRLRLPDRAHRPRCRDRQLPRLRLQVPLRGVPRVRQLRLQRRLHRPAQHLGGHRRSRDPDGHRARQLRRRCRRRHLRRRCRPERHDRRRWPPVRRTTARPCR